MELVAREVVQLNDHQLPNFPCPRVRELAVKFLIEVTPGAGFTHLGVEL